VILDDLAPHEEFTNQLPRSAVLISLAILFLIAQSIPSVFPSLDQWPFIGIPVYIALGVVTHIGVASAFLRSDPRVWKVKSSWLKKNVSVLDPALQDKARAVAWSMVAPRLTLDTAIVSGVGAAGGAYELSAGAASIIGIGTFLFAAWILKRAWLDNERQHFTEILETAAKEL
jgi:hypothetical protein